MEGRGSGNSTINTGLYYDTTLDGSNSVSLGPVSGSGDGNGHTTVTSSARSDPAADRLLKFTATSESDTAGWFITPADAVASVSWRDIISLSDSAAPPDFLRLQFVVDGHLDVTTNSDSGHAIAELGFYFTDIDLLQTANSGTSGFSSYASLSRFYGQTTQTVSGFESHNGDLGAFSAMFEYDAPFDADLGGFTWNLVAMARTSAKDGSAVSDFGGTLRLTAVLGPDGVPLTASDIRFDSGLQLVPASVPEPASVAMLGTSVVVGLGYGWCRRKRAAPPTKGKLRMP